MKHVITSALLLLATTADATGTTIQGGVACRTESGLAASLLDIARGDADAVIARYETGQCVSLPDGDRVTLLRYDGWNNRRRIRWGGTEYWTNSAGMRVGP